MPRLIQNITVKIADSFNLNIGSIDRLRFEVVTLECNHIETRTFEAYLIDFKNASNIELIANNSNYGLTVNKDKTFIEIERSY